MATFTVCIRNHALKSGLYRGTFETSDAALAYATREAQRSRAFCDFEVWSGTPRNPIAPVDGIAVVKGVA